MYLSTEIEEDGAGIVKQGYISKVVPSDEKIRNVLEENHPEIDYSVMGEQVNGYNLVKISETRDGRIKVREVGTGDSQVITENQFRIDELPYY